MHSSPAAFAAMEIWREAAWCAAKLHRRERKGAAVRTTRDRRTLIITRAGLMRLNSFAHWQGTPAWLGLAPGPPQ